MAKFRFGRWSDFADLWHGTIASWNVIADADGSRFLVFRPAADAAAALPAAAATPPPLPHDDGTAAPPSGEVTAQAAAEEPVIWLLPLEAGTAAPVLLPFSQNDDPPSSAAASFVTSSGDHIDFMSSQPAFGIGSGLFVNTDTRTIMTEAEKGFDQIGQGSDDVLVLGGDNGQMSLGGYGAIFERVMLLDGADFDLTSADFNVSSGQALTISGAALGASHHLAFDGSAETDGRFIIEGGAGGDHLTGGRGADSIDGNGGDDTITGGANADTLIGGAGADRFVYTTAADSSGVFHDTILDFTFGEDVIDLPVTVQGLDAAVTHGALSDATLDGDLAAALGGSVLEAGHAVFFTPDSGDLAGHTFLVVDANGEAGYQAGADFLIELPSPPPADFHGTGFLV